MKTHAIRFHTIGSPDVLRWEEIDLDPPGAGEVLLRNVVIGVNMKEIGERQGEYPCPPLPTVPGIEAAAVVLEVGPGVTDFKPGDRVCYATVPTGSYCQQRVLPAERLIALPDDISDELAAATIHKGMTARYLVRKTFPISAGDTVLVHAAAGGTGSLVCQWARHLGATVIGTVGSAHKADYAYAHGCDYVINYREEDFVARVREITHGEGLPVVYDSVGYTTFTKSLECLQPFGLMALYGIASGHPPPLELMKFDIWKSYFYTRPSFFAHTKTRKDLLASAEDLFDVLRKGAVKVEIGGRFALRDAAAAHRKVESRDTIGPVLLFP
ncbi:quinone oxidoreductase family protein [Allosphingosinicella humi]